MKPNPKDYGHEYNADNQLDMLAMELERKLSEVIYDRGTIDSRMVEDLQNYHGQYDSKTLKNMEDSGRSRPFIKLTRAKTNVGEAQLVDLLFPNQDKNWGIKSTPFPELADKMQDDSPAVVDGQQFEDEEGNPVKNSDIAAREQQIIDERCTKMETVINDQLVESGYDASCRDVIHDACVIGTGILKGPVVVGKQDKAYTQHEGQWVTHVKDSYTPATEAVRPWDFFPDMSAAGIEEAEYVFERRYMSKSQLRGLVKRKGFKAEQIKRITKMTGQQTQHTSVYMDDVRQLAGLSSTINDTRFETWEYHGPVSYDVLLDFGVVELPEDQEQQDRLLEKLSGEEVIATVFYCGGVVLGAKMDVMEYEGYLPYRIFNWEPDDSCMFGYGIPRMVRDEQAIINSVWRMILDNGSITAGPQVGVNRKHVRPVDGDWTLKPFKQWELTSSNVDDIRKVFSSMEFNSHLPELQGVYQMARMMFDEVSGVPMISQGEQGQTTETLGGMSMLMNAANTVRRRQVKAWDDDITSPLIKDFYHWNMEYHEDDTVKGDYQVDARGTTALLVKETQAAALTNFLGVVGSNPVFAPVLQIKAAEILRQWAKTQSLPSTILPTDEELEQFLQQQKEQQPEQQDPAIQVEQLRLQQQREKFQFEQAMTDQEIEMKRQEQASKERLKYAELAQSEKADTEKLLVELKQSGAKLDQEWQKFQTELQVKLKFNDVTANYGLAA